MALAFLNGNYIDLLALTQLYGYFQEVVFVDETGEHNLPTTSLFPYCK